MRIATQQRGRSAYTLIELLVVIAIIATLVSLTASAVMAVIQVRVRTEAQFEINKLTDAMTAAQAGMNRGNADTPFPSRLVLYNDLTKYGTLTDALTKKSADTLRRMFGNRLLSSTTPVAWTSGGPTASIVLEGQQCLVFYLGGMPTGTAPSIGMTGFSNDPLNPTAVGGERIGPFYEFKSSRLTVLSTGTNFPSYLDVYAQPGNAASRPYAYFASAGAPNNYNAFGSSDCASLGISPYSEAGSSPVKYLNSKTYQIICAGRDRQFGPGGAWNPTTGTTDLQTRDNLTNFSRGPLLAPQN